MFMIHKALSTETQVKKLISEIRKSLQRDGGDITLVSIDAKKGIVKVKLHGACVHCPFNAITLQEGVESVLKAKIKGVKKVKAV